MAVKRLVVNVKPSHDLTLQRRTQTPKTILACRKSKSAINQNMTVLNRAYFINKLRTQIETPGIFIHVYRE